MSKSGASAPKAVDPTALAQAQVGANLATSQAQSALNNDRTSSPFGTSNFEQDPSGRWNLTQTLNPTLQTAFNNESGLAGLLSQYGGNLADIAAAPAIGGANLIEKAYNQLGNQIPTGPVSTEGLPSLPNSQTDFANEVGQAQKAAYNTQAGFLDPQFAEKQSDLRTQLADEGIPVGSDAYSRAQGDLGRQSDLAYQQAQNAAIQAGNQEQATLFGEDLNANNQGFNQRVTQWGEPLAALNSAAGTGEGILSGAINGLTGLSPLSNFTWGGQIPTFGSQGTVVPGANIVGAANTGVQSAANAFSAGNTLNNQLFNGLGSLGGALGLGNGGLGSLIGSVGTGVANSAPLVGDALGAIGADYGGGGAGAGLLGFLGSLF